MMRDFALALFVSLLLPPTGATAELAATVAKPTVDVYAQPSFEAARLKSLQRGESVSISAQHGLWYQLPLKPEAQGYVRVNDVRIVSAAPEDEAANVRVLMGEMGGRGRVTETAGVRGIDESDLKAAALDQAQLNGMVANRVDVASAATHAASQGWQATPVAFAAEPAPVKPTRKDANVATRSETVKAVSGLLGAINSELGYKVSKSEKVVPKGEGELAAEELALGPEIAGRILGARPLLADPEVQRRVNVVGRWVASQTSRPELPWTFGVIDTPEVNAFAAPGGYVLVTRGLYELLSSDSELAAVIAHEIGHCVQRDHYKVIRQQELAASGKELAMTKVPSSTGNPATDFARRYAEQHGATIMLTALDREAEYRADESAQYYLARSGTNPLALYSVLQKLAAMGPASAGLAQLYKTHPPLDARIDRLDQYTDGPLQAYTQR